MTHPNAALITRFYQAFQQLDAETMASCYSEDVQFSDPVFTDLRGAAADDMWRMLCAKLLAFNLHTIIMSGLPLGEQTTKIQPKKSDLGKGSPLLAAAQVKFFFAVHIP